MQLYHHMVIYLNKCNMHMQYWNNFNKQIAFLFIWTLNVKKYEMQIWFLLIHQIISLDWCELCMSDGRHNLPHTVHHEFIPRLFWWLQFTKRLLQHCYRFFRESLASQWCHDLCLSGETFSGRKTGRHRQQHILNHSLVHIYGYTELLICQFILAEKFSWNSESTGHVEFWRLAKTPTPACKFGTQFFQT